MRPLWLSRPLLNWPDVYRWGEEAGVSKMIPPDQLHTTLATVRVPVEWDDLELETDELVIPAGPKPVQIFSYIAKGLCFTDLSITARHAYLVDRFPKIDHHHLRPHVTLFRGGKMPRVPYTGELVFGPERAQEFDEVKAKDIKHVKIRGYTDENA